MSFLETADATSIADQVRTGRTSPGVVVEHFLAKVDAGEASIQAFVSLDLEGVRKQAAELTDAGLGGLLAGVPLASRTTLTPGTTPQAFTHPFMTTTGHRVMLMRLHCCVRRER